MRAALRLSPQTPCRLALTLEELDGLRHVLRISSDVPTFGPQPWLALKTVTGTYHHDNLDMDEPFKRWQYVLDEETFPLRALETIGIAANNAFGIGTVVTMDPRTGAVNTKHWNEPAAAKIAAG